MKLNLIIATLAATAFAAPRASDMVAAEANIEARADNCFFASQCATFWSGNAAARLHELRSRLLPIPGSRARRVVTKHSEDLIKGICSSRRTGPSEIWNERKCLSYHRDGGSGTQDDMRDAMLAHSCGRALGLA
ncbi:hypothetical protein P153DRAFT_390647 [Dothidotthia symphoricarpi CBS 119687]|uniref:Uncharacterized protein n=1 Tax=Dothidotthia symphoricarpi CBS 119687 TaxID=1392245 RepID=A0A6A5ZYJ3_9PLEO|nr:uncharacterized protein P153DRAFT_390647 [Dothidotthia symphoricarpi CBS 119687]KAF2124609.1 hypothetical protein P153DRAFT_390647 [Dothidotthia symphoricarpi CBS 119687]